MSSVGAPLILSPGAVAVEAATATIEALSADGIGSGEARSRFAPFTPALRAGEDGRSHPPP